MKEGKRLHSEPYPTFMAWQAMASRIPGSIYLFERCGRSLYMEFDRIWGIESRREPDFPVEHSFIVTILLCIIWLISGYFSGPGIYVGDIHRIRVYVLTANVGLVSIVSTPWLCLIGGLSSMKNKRLQTLYRNVSWLDWQNKWVRTKRLESGKWNSLS